MNSTLPEPVADPAPRRFFRLGPVIRLGVRRTWARFAAGWVVLGGLTGGTATVADGWKVERIAGGRLHDGPGNAAAFSDIGGLAWHPAGGLVVADTGNHCIRRVSGDGHVTTLAGTGALGWRDGRGSEATFRSPGGVAVDRDGIIWVADLGNHCVRRIGPDGGVTTFAGKPLEEGEADGPMESARFSYPNDVTVTADGRILVVESERFRIRSVAANGWVTTVARSTAGPAFAQYRVGAARWFEPVSVATSPESRLLVGEMGSFVRLSGLDMSDHEQSLWETGQFGFALNWDGGMGVAWDGRGRALVALSLWITRDATVPGDRYDGVYVAEGGGALVPLAERLPQSGANVSNRLATDPEGNVYVARGGLIVRVSRQGEVSVLAGRTAEAPVAGQGSGANLTSINGLARFPDGSLVLSEGLSHRLWRVSPGGELAWWSGSEGGGFADGASGAAKFSEPGGLTVDRTGVVLVADTGNHRIRRVRADGTVTTVAGDGQPGRRDGSAELARFEHPRGVAVDSKGSIFVIEGGPAIRVIRPDGTVTSRWASQFAEGSGNGGIRGIWVDAQDRVWVSAAGRVLELLPDDTSAVRYDLAEFVRLSPFMERPEVQAFTVDAGGNLWLASDLGFEVVRLSAQGVPLKAVSDRDAATAPNPPAGLGIAAPMLMVSDPAGGVVFWDERQGALLRLRPDRPAGAGVSAMPEMPNVAVGRPLRMSALFPESPEPAAFQWLRNGEPLDGQNRPDLTVDQFAAELAGNFSVVMQQAGASVTSAPVRVGIMALPRILVPPQSTVTHPGQFPNVAVKAEGEGELRYQWFYGESPVPLGTLPIYFPRRLPAPPGRLKVRVYNEAGWIESDPVTYSTWELKPDGRTELVGPVGTRYRLETAAAMSGPWEREREFTLESPTNQWAMPTDGSATSRFFRVVPLD